MNRFSALILCFFIAAPLAGTPADEKQTVAVIGTGDMGDSLGPQFARLGYRVVYGHAILQAKKPARWWN